jgi:hypothetical protein
MRRTPTPKRWAVKQWPSSWRTTHVEAGLLVSFKGHVRQKQQKAEVQRQLNAADAEQVD